MEIKSTNYDETDLNDNGCFNLLSRVVETYFNKNLRYVGISYNDNDSEQTKREKRIKKAHCPMDSEDLTFANSKVLYAWADCSNNFEADKLKKQINKAFIDQQEEYLLDIKASKLCI